MWIFIPLFFNHCFSGCLLLPLPPRVSPPSHAACPWRRFWHYPSSPHLHRYFQQKIKLKKPLSTQPFFNLSKRIYFRCGDKSHMAQQCRNDILCRNCHHVGHYAATCRSPFCSRSPPPPPPALLQPLFFHSKLRHPVTIIVLSLLPPPLPPFIAILFLSLLPSSPPSRSLSYSSSHPLQIFTPIPSSLGHSTFPLHPISPFYVSWCSYTFLWRSSPLLLSTTYFCDCHHRRGFAINVGIRRWPCIAVVLGLDLETL